MKSILYVNGKFILSSDPMDRGPLRMSGLLTFNTDNTIGSPNTYGWVLTGWNPKYLSTAKWSDPYLEEEKWKGIPVVPTNYSNVSDVMDDIIITHYNENTSWLPVGINSKGSLIMKNWATGDLEEFTVKK